MNANANAYKNRKGTEIGIEELIKTGIKILPYIILLAVISGVLFIYNFYPQQEAAPYHSFSISSSELINEVVMAKDFFVVERIPEQKIAITGLLKSGYGKVIVTAADGKEVLYSFDKNTNGLVLPPPEEWQSLKVTGYW